MSQATSLGLRIRKAKSLANNSHLRQSWVNYIGESKKKGNFFPAAESGGLHGRE